MGFVELINHMRKMYGPVAKLGGIPGKPDVIMLFDAEDFEKVSHKTARPIQSSKF